MNKMNFMKPLSGIVALIISISLLTGCASMSCMQTARTTEKGKLAGGFGAGTVKMDIGLKDTSGKVVNIKAPFLELFGRYGITDKWDVGAKLTLIGTFLVDTKYQFLGDAESKLASSIGFGAGFMSIKSGDFENKITDIHIPYYISVHPTKWLGIYANPRYVYRMTKSTNTSENTVSKGNSSWYGLTGGLRFGKNSGLFIEYSYFGSKGVNPLSQVTVGLGFGIR